MVGLLGNGHAALGKLVPHIALQSDSRTSVND
jgi:hypothetical protein